MAKFPGNMPWDSPGEYSREFAWGVFLENIPGNLPREYSLGNTPRNIPGGYSRGIFPGKYSWGIFPINPRLSWSLTFPRNYESYFWVIDFGGGRNVIGLLLYMVIDFVLIWGFIFLWFWVLKSEKQPSPKTVKKVQQQIIQQKKVRRQSPLGSPKKHCRLAIGNLPGH